MWWLSVNRLTDPKLAGHKRGQCLEDYHRRFGYTESLHKNGAKTIKWWWSERVPHAGVSRHHRASWNWTRLASLVIRHGFLSMAQKPSARAVSGSFWHQRKQDSQSHVDHTFWCEGHLLQVLATEPDDQSESQQGAYLTQYVRRDEN